MIPIGSQVSSITGWCFQPWWIYIYISKYIYIYGPFIDGLPMKNGDFLYIYIWLVVSTYPSEKWWSEFVSWDDFPFPTVSGNIKAVFQTTDQLLSSIRIPIQSPLFPMKNPKFSAPKKKSPRDMGKWGSTNGIRENEDSPAENRENYEYMCIYIL